MNKLIFLIPLSLLMLGCTTSNTSKLKINDQIFNVELAESSVDRAQGLMFRKNLDLNAGMLFLFSTSDKHSFWMKNTYLPLDIIWINSDLEIVHIHNNAQPCQDTCPSLLPDQAAKYVLEINAGLAKKHNFKIGDKVELT
jgi:uncharacterized protein